MDPTALRRKSAITIDRLNRNELDQMKNVCVTNLEPTDSMWRKHRGLVDTDGYYWPEDNTLSQLGEILARLGGAIDGVPFQFIGEGIIGLDCGTFFDDLEGLLPHIKSLGCAQFDIARGFGFDILR